MAVTLTLADIQAYLSTIAEAQGRAPADDAYLARWLASATEIIQTYAPLAPETIQNRACEMVIDYWSASPAVAAQQRQMVLDDYDTWFSAEKLGNALRYSGAMAALTRYVRRRALG